MSASSSVPAEKRPLKRARIGPPDFYPQDPKQKEDELSPEKLKAGYINHTLPNEYDCAKIPKSERVDEFISKVTGSLNSIFSKKADLNTLNADKDRKKFRNNAEISFWHASAKPKDKDLWFRDLAGKKPLTALAKRFPIFNKKEEIFSTLCEFNIPMCRAAWFVKMTAAHYTMQLDQGKINKRKQQSDPCSEWTLHLSRFLKELLLKLSEYYTLNAQPIMNSDVALFLKQWSYCSRFARFMFEEGLLERQEFLSWLLDVFYEKSQNKDSSGILKLYLPFLMQFVEGITRSEQLSRRMMFICCRKLYQLYIDLDTSSIPCAPNRVPSPLTCYREYLQCGYHRHVIISLSALIHAVMLDCPTALVWNYLGDSSPAGNLGETKYAYLCGSPLDSLPCAPSLLPMPEGDKQTDDMIRNVLRSCEKDIIRRSQAVDARWSSDKCQQSGLGTMVPAMLSTLEALDKRRYDQFEPIDNLYEQIFQSDCKEAEEGGDATVIKLLCHWAVSAQRVGTQRSLVVVGLLEKRKSDVIAESRGVSESRYPFQKALFDYLDTEAPLLTENCGCWSAELFSLVHLYSELIRADLFSHDQYLCSLISRGELSTTLPSTFQQQQQQQQQQQTRIGQKISQEEHDFTETVEEQPPRVDLERILASIGDDRPEQQAASNNPPLSVGSSAPGSVDIQPSSVESSSLEGLTPAGPTFGPFGNNLRSISGGSQQGNSGSVNNPKTEEKLSRHQLYVLHFPIPQDEQYRHECNQRQTLLFDGGNVREAQKTAIKKLTREISRIWQKKSCVECSDSGGVKTKRKLSAEAVNSLTSKFRSLSVYDQHVTLGLCADSFVEELKDFVSAESQVLPSGESVDYLLKLMEMGVYIYGFLDFIDEVVELLVKIETELKLRKCQLAGSYGFQIGLCLIGYLRRHYAYFLLCQEEMENIFNQFLILFDGGGRWGQLMTSSWERGVGVFLKDLADSYPDIKTEVEGKFSKVEERLKKCPPFRVDAPSTANLQYDRNFLREQWESSKKRLDLSLMEKINREDREGAEKRYSFVVNAILAVTRCGADKDKLGDLCSFCADATAACPILAADWLGALKALCCSAAATSINQSIGFSDLLVQVEVNDQCLHGPIATFVMALVSRYCISLDNLVLHVLNPSLYESVKSLGISGKIRADVQAESRLTLTILAAVLCLSEDSGFVQVRLTAERYLLCASHDSFVAPGVLTVLIAMLLLADGGPTESESSTDILKGGRSNGGSLDEFASQVLSAVCSQEWISRKFLYQADLFTDKLLLNSNIKPEQAQKLLRLITRRNCEKGLVKELNGCSSKKSLIGKLLSSLNLWNLRTAMLELQLLLKQAPASEYGQVVEVIARSCMDLFHNESRGSPVQNSGCNSLTNGANQLKNGFRVSGVSNYWLVAPLISRLPTNVQGKVLKAAASVLENGQLTRKDKGTSGLQQSAWLLGQQPFLCLVLTCLNGQEEQREGLLSSLLKQLQEYVHRAKERPIPSSLNELTADIAESLQLRLSLVGGMLETACKTTNIETWSLLLIQLMIHNVVSMETDSSLFATCLDMLTICIHSCLVPGACGTLAPERTPEECRRLYMTVIKKLKKEVGERYNPALRSVHQLLPIPKATIDIITSEPYGAQSQPKLAKGAPAPAPPPVASSSRQGLKVAGKERVSPWELVEGVKGWSWTWFQALKVDSQTDSAQAQIGKLLSHDHYHNFDRPPLPGMEQRDPFLEPLKVQIDQQLLQRERIQQLEIRKKETGQIGPQQMIPPQGQIPLPPMSSEEMARRNQMQNQNLALLQQQHQHQQQMMMMQHQQQQRGMSPQEFPQPHPVVPVEPPPPAPVSGRGKGKRKSTGEGRRGRKNSKGATTPPVATVGPSSIPYTTGQPGGYTGAPVGSGAQQAPPPPNWIVQQTQQPQPQPGPSKYQVTNQTQHQQAQTAMNQTGKEALRTFINTRFSGPPGAAGGPAYQMQRQSSAEGFQQGTPQHQQQLQQAQMMHHEMRQQVSQEMIEHQRQQQQARQAAMQRQVSMGQMSMNQQQFPPGPGQMQEGGPMFSRAQTMPPGGGRPPQMYQQISQEGFSANQSSEQQQLIRQRLLQQHQQQQQQGVPVSQINPRMAPHQQQMPPGPFPQGYNTQRMQTQYSLQGGPPHDQMFPGYQ